ncbi:MAG: glycerol-3-phosphate dehydrogenase/oxidase [Dehalococcoidia bacterium]
MRRSLADIAPARFDVIVIGGGINGAGIARETQLAGFRTLLIERNDFGSGTTSRATRLIHGGLRYLEHGEFGLVYESLAEREALVRDAAHLVRPLELLVPVYAGDQRPPWKVRAGLVLYDILSFRKSLPRHRAVPSRKIDELAPALNRDGLRGAFTFHDAQVEFPERLVIEAVRDFSDAGGVALNHVSALRLVSPGGVLQGVIARDELTHDEAQLNAGVVINATGPWVDNLLCGSDAERHEPLIGGTKGSHLVVAWPDAPKRAIFASAKADGRPFFILPWYRCTLIGTTDMRYDGDPSTARATAAEVSYLIDETNRLFPTTPLGREHVLYTYSGVRPLPHTTGNDESTITRSHFVIDHVKRGGPAGLLTIVGGKLTTYRSLARIALGAVRKHVKPSGDPQPSLRPSQARAVSAYARIDDDPLALYGARADEVRALAGAEPRLNEPMSDENPELLAQVAYAIDREHAVTIADVLLRRLPSGWAKGHAFDGVERVAEVMAERLGWDASERLRAIDAYQEELRQTLVPLDAISQ